jgi:hypothetical protein
MELIGHDLSRIVYLTTMNRREGGVLLPDVAHKVVQKYSFARYPNFDDLQNESFAFKLGKFRDFQIDELRVYTDGVIVASKCSTEILSEFLNDLLGWIKSDFGYREITILKPEMHFESALVVKTDKDIASLLSPPKRVTSLIEQTLAKNTEAEYQATGISFETDSEGLKKRRRPGRFRLERRVDLPFGTNTYYSTAPLTSTEHLMLLDGLEGLAL